MEQSCNQKNELVVLYLAECDKLLAAFDKIIMDSDAKDELTDTAELFRIMHTLKGSSAMMEYTSLAELAHRFEDVLSKIKSSGVIPSGKALVEIIDAAISFSAFFHTQLTKIQNGGNADENDKLVKMFDMLDANGISDSESADPDAQKADALSFAVPESVKPEKLSGGAVRLRVLLRKCQLPHIRAFIIVKSVKQYCLQLETKPDNLDKITGRDEEILKNGFEISFVPSDVSCINTVTEKISAQPFVTSCTVIEEEKPQKTDESATDISANVMVSQSTVNSLIHYIDELASEESALEAFIDESGLNSGKGHGLVSALRHTLREVGILASGIGTHSIDGGFMQMQLTVRTMARELNKEIKVQLYGADIQADKSILEILSDSLIHIVRNSADHGIELPEERKAAGKPETGTIILSAVKKNDYLTVTVSDDGRGVNCDEVFWRAEKKGLLKKSRENYTDSEAANLLLSFGISTKNTVTQYSGRGVGLDTVVRRINQVGGKVSVESSKGKGTSFVLKIPMSLSVIDGIEVTTLDGSGLVVPTNAVRHISAAAKTEEHNCRIVYMGTEYKRLCFPGEHADESKNGFVLFLTDDFGIYYLKVNQISRMRSYYIKPLPVCVTDSLGRGNIYSGCVLCADSQLKCILDADKLIALSEAG